MKMIKNLSVNVTNANSNFHVREDLNFTDDGNHFRGFDYKGLPITTLRTGGQTYCAIRVDYLNSAFTYSDWRNTEEYNLTDEFNGVDEIDLDKLIENCERILARVAELNEKAKSEVLDMTGVISELEEERIAHEAILAEARTSVRWWELSKWDLQTVQGAYNSLTKELERINKLLAQFKEGTVERKAQRNFYFNLKNYGYIVSDGKGYYVERLRESM